jgi:hypothetical protein
MIEALIGGALTALASSEGAKTAGKEMSSSVWQAVRPLFLKDDEEAGKKELAVVEAAPASPEAQALVKEKLTKHLAASPEVVQQLQQILQQGTGGVHNYGNVEKQVNNPIISKGDFNM